MGAVLRRAGIQTALYDVSADALDARRPRRDGGRRSRAARRHQGRRRRHQLESDLATALAGCQLVIEAAPERLDLKQELFAEFERYVTPDAILASNTRASRSRRSRRPAEPRARRRHALSKPPHMIPMIEVIPGRPTAKSTVDATVQLVTGHRLPRVVEREVPGFVENRILYAICASASISSIAASSTRPGSARTCAGASATSSP